MGDINDTFEPEVELSLELTNELISILQNEASFMVKRIQILPDDMVKEMNVRGIVSIEDQTNEVHEIVLSKSQMMQVFLECYTCLYKCKENDPSSRRVASLGILLITSNDTTAVSHLSSVFQDSIEVQYRTLLTIGAYLTCSYDKTNKSSVLWTFFKKLYVSLSTTKDLIRYSIRVCLNSIREHPRNYYACNSLRFFIANIGDVVVWNDALLMLVRFLQKYDDYSVWMVILDCILHLKTKQLDYYRYARVRLKYCEGIVKGIYYEMKVFVMMVRPFGGLVTLVTLHEKLGIDSGLMDELNSLCEDSQFGNENVKRVLLRRSKKNL